MKDLSLGCGEQLSRILLTEFYAPAPAHFYSQITWTTLQNCAMWGGKDVSRIRSARSCYPRHMSTVPEAQQVAISSMDAV